MKKRIYTRLAAGLLCGALLLTDAVSLDVWAVSNDLNAGQIAPLAESDEESDASVISNEGEAATLPEKEAEEEKTESAAAEKTEEEEADNPNQEADEPEGDNAPVNEDEEEATQPVEEEPESLSEEEQTSVSENAVEEEQDSVSENTAKEEANINSVTTLSEEDPIAQGTSNNISWVIDADGKLTVSGTGDWERRDGKYAPWYDDRESITTAEISISGAGMRGMTNASYMFYGCSNLTTLDTNNFNTQRVMDMSSMFEGCKSLTTLDVSNFKTSYVKDMSRMFYGCSNLTTLNLKSNTLKATNMSGMFEGCSSLTRLDVSNFNTNNVTDMSRMFYGCSNLIELDLSNFNTNNVTDMSRMFYGCSNLIELDLGSFDMQNVITAAGMFDDCTYLTCIYTPRNLSQSVSLPSVSETWYRSDSTVVTELPQNLNYSVVLVLGSIPTDVASGESNDISWVIDADRKLTVSGTGDWERRARYAPWVGYRGSIRSAEISVTNMTDASYMFHGCSKLTILDVSNFNTANVTDMSNMFYNCNNLTALDVSHFDTSNVTNMRGMFEYCCKLNTLDISNFDTAGVTDMYRMFYECKNLATLDVSHFNTSNVTNMSDMFYGCNNLTALDVSHFDTSNVTNMSGMFWNCSELNTLDVSKFDTANVTDMSNMFYNCNNLTALDVSHFDTSNVTNMSGMFWYCSELNTLDVSKFDTANVTDMSYMFWDCAILTALDLGSFDTGGLMEAFGMLYGCDNLTTIYTPRNLTQSVSLPTGGLREDDVEDIWYRSDGTEVTELPQNLDYSVALGRNYIPTDKNPDDAPSDDDPKDDNNDGVDPKDIPQDGIPKGLWISEIEDQTYTGTAIKPEVRVYDGEKRLKEGTDYTLKYKNNTNAAKFDDAKPPMIEVKSKGNYSGTETKTFTITKRNISDTYVTKTFTNAYTPLTNGGNPNLLFSAKCNNRALKKNTDYTLIVKDNAGKEATSYGAVGTYTAVVKGAGNYTGEYTFAFEVLNKVPVSKLKIGKIATVNYDGTSKTPEPVIKYGTKTLTKDTDYSLSYLNNTAIGTAVIVITGKGEYFGTRNVTFSIAGLPIKKVRFTGFQTSFPYTGAEIRQTAAVLKYGEEELKEGKDYTVSYSNHRNKGKAAVTYTGIGKYTGTLKKTYSITAYNIAKDDQKRIKLSTDTISAVYAKGGARPFLKVYDGTRLLTEGSDYTLTYQNNAAVTTPTTKNQPTITVKGKGNYAGTSSERKTFTITAKNIAEVTATAPDAAASTRTGKYKSTPVLIDTNGKKLKAGTDYDRTYTYTYKTTTEKVLNDGAEVTRNAGDPVDAKDIVPANTVLCVRIKAKEGGNYTGETTAEYRIAASLINKAKITVKNPAQNNTNLFPYTGQAIRLEKSCLTVKVGREVLSDDQYEILESTHKNNVGKGTASVQIKGVGNYGGTATVKFKIGTKGFRWVKRLFG